MNGEKYEEAGGETYGQTDGQSCGQMDKQTRTWTDRQTGKDRRIDRLTDGERIRTDRRSNKQNFLMNIIQFVLSKELAKKTFFSNSNSK
jgi:hypothetical protein